MCCQTEQQKRSKTEYLNCSNCYTAFSDALLQVQRLIMICDKKHDDDDDDLVAVAVNNLAFICRDLGTERFAPFFQSCVEVVAKLLRSAVPSAASAEEDSDYLPVLQRLEALSDAVEVMASGGSRFLFFGLPLIVL